MSSAKKEDRIKVQLPAMEVELDAKPWAWYQKHTGAVHEWALRTDIEWALNGLLDSLYERGDFFASWLTQIEEEQEKRAE